MAAGHSYVIVVGGLQPRPPMLDASIRSLGKSVQVGTAHLVHSFFDPGQARALIAPHVGAQNWIVLIDVDRHEHRYINAPEGLVGFVGADWYGHSWPEDQLFETA